MYVICVYLHKDSRAQKMTHLLQDLFLKYIPCHCTLQIQNKWIAKPAGVTKTKRFDLHQVKESFEITL